MAIGAGEANAVKSVIQAIDKLDVIGQMMGKAFSLAGNIAKPMLNKAGKGFVYVFEKNFKIAETYELKFNTGKLYAGLPFPELRKKVEKLTEADIAKLPADENGIRIADVDEQAIPIGPEESLDKIGQQ
ncbi:hypothetical protein BPO_p0041 (plasmid) [Bergeyella porcorum]|uniref:Uncharacterized protein n=2 Tax=Bergeyella porcorum TaxID=1735111 RepID=A0AAU0F2Y4_9FLAO